MFDLNQHITGLNEKYDEIQMDLREHYYRQQDLFPGDTYWSDAVAQVEDELNTLADEIWLLSWIGGLI